MTPLRIIFMGTPDFAVPTLRAILEAGHEVVAVYTRAPRPAGRGMAPRKSAVHEVAEQAGLPVLTPERLKSPKEQDRFPAFGADAAMRITTDAVQVFGGYGYMTEYPIARAYVDSRVTSIYGGTNEVMKTIIARSLGL